jgi:hypothetical protein
MFHRQIALKDQRVASRHDPIQPQRTQSQIIAVVAVSVEDDIL